jgi:hypothetical protein
VAVKFVPQKILVANTSNFTECFNNPSALTSLYRVFTSIFRQIENAKLHTTCITQEINVADFLKSLMGKKGKSTPVADEAVETAKLMLNARVNRMMAHSNQNERPSTSVGAPPLAG